MEQNFWRDSVTGEKIEPQKEKTTEVVFSDFESNDSITQMGELQMELLMEILGVTPEELEALALDFCDQK